MRTVRFSVDLIWVGTWYELTGILFRGIFEGVIHNHTIFRC